MRAIVVDDEPVMVRHFERESRNFPELNLKASFTSGKEALEYAEHNSIEVAFLDVEMPEINGIDLAVELRKLRPDMLIVFVSAYDYVRDSNKIGGDYYLMKPYDREMMRLMIDRITLLASRQKRRVYIHMFGTFTVTFDGKPVPLRGKAKEILAYVAMFRGEEVSNQTIFSALWEDKPYGNREMTLYYHAMKRLKETLGEYHLEELLISNARGQMLNTDMVDCDYYAWQDENAGKTEKFSGYFLSEYSWSENYLADLFGEMVE